MSEAVVYCAHCGKYEKIKTKRNWFGKATQTSLCGMTVPSSDNMYDEHTCSICSKPQYHKCNTNPVYPYTTYCLSCLKGYFHKLRCSDPSCAAALVYEDNYTRARCSICLKSYDAEQLTNMVILKLPNINHKPIDIRWDPQQMNDHRFAHVHLRGTDIPANSTLTLAANQACFYTASGRPLLFYFDANGTTLPLFPDDMMDNEERRNALYTSFEDPLSSNVPYKLDTNIVFFNTTLLGREYSSKPSLISPCKELGYQFNLKALQYTFCLIPPKQFISDPEMFARHKDNLLTLENLAFSLMKDDKNDYPALEEKIVSAVENQIRMTLEQEFYAEFGELQAGQDTQREIRRLLDNPDYRTVLVNSINKNLATNTPYSMYELRSITFDHTLGFIQPIASQDRATLLCPKCNGVIDEVRDVNSNVLGPKCPSCGALINYCSGCKRYILFDEDRPRRMCECCGTPLYNNRWFD